MNRFGLYNVCYDVLDREKEHFFSTKHLVIVFITALFLSACGPKQLPPDLPGVKEYRYLFIGHPRHNNTGIQRMDSLVEQLDYGKYDAVLLGGDLTANSSLHDSTLNYLDGIFDLSSPQTMLAPGNHDVDRMGRLLAFTQRPAYFSYHQEGTTFLVLDTQRDQCSMRGDQLALIQALTDTLQDSDQLVVIHHKLMWLPDHPDLGSLVSTVPNAGLCSWDFCTFRNNFWQDFYPLLQKVKDRGVDVLLIAGDLGGKQKFFSWTSPENIHFLASGINQGDTDNQALVLTKNMESRELIWESVLLENLP